MAKHKIPNMSSAWMHGYMDFQLGLGRTVRGNPDYEDGYNQAHVDAFATRADAVNAARAALAKAS